MDDYSPFDLDMMKRAMEPAAFETSKKPRYGPTAAKPAAPSVTPSFENYGYGGSGPPQPQPPPTPHMSQHNLAALYTSHPAAMNMNIMTTPNSAQAATTAAPPSPYVSSPAMSLGYNSNGMMGMGVGMNMGMPGMAMSGMNMFNVGSMGAFGYNPQMASFPQTPASTMGSFVQSGNPLPSPVLGNFGMAQGHYNPAVAAAAAAAANNATGRTVYVGSLPPSASVDELLNLVHFGPLESIRVLPNKSCVFLSFLDGATAAAFHADASLRKITLHGQELKIGWGKASPVPTSVLMAITQSGASRNVYIGGLDEGMTEEQLRDDLSRFGLIDQVKIVKDKNIGFVHFLSIATATKVVGTLPQEPAWAGKRVNYGKDRCAYVPKSQQAAAAAAQVAAAQSLVAQQYAGTSGLPVGGNSFGDMSNPSQNSGLNLSAMAQGAAQNAMNRTIYLGNIHPDTTTEDICNAVRGGVLQSIRYMPDKHICFVTFIDPTAAYSFFQSTTFQGLTINNRRVKIGWGKNSGALPPNIAMAVHGGATRNVYIGNIKDEDWELYSEERLRKDFGEFGEIELVNFFKEKNCAFVNFTNIAHAIKAIEIIKLKPEYASLRVSHGKDRCANPPRVPTASGGGAKRNTNGTTHATNGATHASHNTNTGASENLTAPASAVNGIEEEHLAADESEDTAIESQIRVKLDSDEAEVFIPSENDEEEVGKLVQE